MYMYICIYNNNKYYYIYVYTYPYVYIYIFLPRTNRSFLPSLNSSIQTQGFGFNPIRI